MLTTSKYIMHGSSTRCTFCNKPFCFRDGYVELWRTANGEHFCSEFCADDAEEAQFFVCSIPPRLQVLRPPIQPNHSYLISGGRTDNATKTENCLRDTSGRRAKSLERRIGAEAIRRIITACRSGRMAAGAIGGISENAPTRLSPAYEAEEPSALR
jgi:hypothetical protein